ncbi:MAG: ABC transporter ATP-binding protein [Clostridia bacterium]
MALLEADTISISFGGLVAVNGVSFHVNQGEIVSIIGPNGAGKTTIFNLITGLYSLSEGSITFDGKRIDNKIPQEIVKAGIARTFQNIRIFPQMRVIENVMIGQHTRTKYGFFSSLLRLPNFRKEEAIKTYEAIEFLKKLDFDDRADLYAGSLPYGDMRKLEIARAMATDAKLLLLDEPAAGMNPQESMELVHFIGKIRDMGYTILLIEHDMNVVMNISDRIYVVDYGKLIAEGLPEDVRVNKDVIRAYLGGHTNVAVSE